MKVSVVALLSLGLTACNVFPSSLRDLSIVRVTRLAGKAMPEMVTRTPPDRLSDYLVVTLATGQNLISKSNAAELNIYPLVRDCADRDRTMFAYGPYIDGIKASYMGLDRDHSRYKMLASLRKNRFEYEVFIPVSGPVNLESDNNRRVPGYDLSRQLFDLCIRIGGGNMLGGSFRSNEVRIHFGPATGPAR